MLALKIVTKFSFAVLLSAMALAANAAPVLQLGIGEGVYDSDTRTSMATSNVFTLYAYARATGKKAIDVNETHYIAVALTPMTGPEPQPIGSFEFGGTTYDGYDMVYGNPPLEDQLQYDRGDLRPHGIYDTLFLEVEFLFDASRTTSNVNTRRSPDHIPEEDGSRLYFASFEVDISNLDPQFGLHFDLYSQRLRRGGDIDIDAYAPFTHDAAAQVASAPEPGSLALIASGLFGLVVKRRRLVNAR